MQKKLFFIFLSFFIETVVHAKLSNRLKETTASFLVRTLREVDKECCPVVEEVNEQHSIGVARYEIFKNKVKASLGKEQEVIKYVPIFAGLSMGVFTGGGATMASWAMADIVYGKAKNNKKDRFLNCLVAGVMVGWFMGSGSYIACKQLSMLAPLVSQNSTPLDVLQCGKCLKEVVDSNVISLTPKAAAGALSNAKLLTENGVFCFNHSPDGEQGIDK